MSEVPNIRAYEMPLKGDFQNVSTITATDFPSTASVEFDKGEIVYISIGRPTLAPRSFEITFTGRSGDTDSEVLIVAVPSGIHAFRMGFAIESISFAGTAGVAVISVWRTPPGRTEPGC